jgi:hypothetical protein
MRYWALGQTYLGVLPSATAFTPVDLGEALANMRNDEDNYNAARKEADVQQKPIFFSVGQMDNVLGIIPHVL